MIFAADDLMPGGIIDERCRPDGIIQRQDDGAVNLKTGGLR